MLDAEEEAERRKEEDNLNPFTFKHCLDNNMLGSHKWAGKYDFLWYGKYHQQEIFVLYEQSILGVEKEINYEKQRIRDVIMFCK